MHRHNEALRCYYERDWERARKLFALLKRQDPQDRIYDYYLERVAEYRTEPPPPDWRGEIRYSVK